MEFLFISRTSAFFALLVHISYAQCTCPPPCDCRTQQPPTLLLCFSKSISRLHRCHARFLPLTNRAGAHSLPLLVNRDENMQRSLPPSPPGAVSEIPPAFLHFFPERGIQCKHHIDFTSYRPSVAQLHYNPQNLGVILGKCRNYDVADLRSTPYSLHFFETS